MNNLVLLILLLFLIGVFPIWPYSAHWGYFPGGGIGLILLIAIIYALTNRRTIR